MIQFNGKTLLKKQKHFSILSQKQYSLQKWRVFGLNIKRNTRLSRKIYRHRATLVPRLRYKHHCKGTKPSN